ncbi:hypothetical protein EW146_g5495 [Bondarzewia mesenterica]|uniref:Hcy-binding domain-containing protein n=1 Tax=Bondarzewia mesenterica TaxID=1095465 RepID=A0A4S4LSD8_9AGAM|nr:hypothetical protein EW146_g5495 [Bondarzewia mesenterica]
MSPLTQIYLLNRPIDEDPEAIIQAHLAFLRAGARIISTSTYQCAFATFEDAGYSHSDAVLLMHKSVKLAAEARIRFVDETNGIKIEDIKIALSLGPFGATLQPAQEFDGFYPPPYGPQSYSPLGPNNNAFTDAEKNIRLRVFSNDIETWAHVDCIAFETMPLVREITAVRGAMTILQRELAPRGERFPWKPWWISAVWPEGRYPHGKVPGGERMSVKDVVAFIIGKGSGDVTHLAVDRTIAPDGLGINCTSMEHLADILKETDSAVAKIKNGKTKPWLAVYPNGGEKYDSISRTWIQARDPQAQRDDWAKGLASLIKESRGRGVWDGFIVGGCCKTGPEEIKSLSQYLAA